MAEERSVELARTSEDSSEVDPTKAELQRRMEEARESISQTVSEIKDTVVTQYQQVKETINDTLDWREQYKRHTLPFTLTAFAVGTFVGYTVMGAFKGGGEDDDFDTEDTFDRIDRGFDEGARSYAASPVIGKSRGASAYQRAARPESNAATESAEVFGGGHSQESGADVGPSPRPSYSSGYSAPTAQQAQGLTSQKYSQAVSEQSSTSSLSGQEEEEPKGPGLIERFKETKAYDRLTDELSTLGERVVEELSSTARTVVVPMLLNKLKGLIGVDLSGQRGARQAASGAGTQSGGGGQQQSQGFTSSGAGAQGTPSQTSSGSDASASAGSGGTSARAAGAGGTEGYGAS
ncbi:MAG TPA: hypothetical protein VM914_10000 [Pyrinomonadaceae bacterium]|jgi:hypothetical protein|nr:hypothetical protein [Pyrinomonadaceae bacterium]